MQQMVQLVPFLTLQVPQTQVTGPGPAAVPGLFQALLLEALTGAQTTALSALPVATAPQMAAPPAEGAVAAVPQMPPQLQLSQTQLPQPAQTPPQGAADLPALPLRLSGPTPPAVLVEAQLPALDSAPAEGEETEPVAAAPELPQQAPQTPPPALQAQVAAMTQAAPAAQPQTMPGAPARPQPQTQAQPLPAGEEPANPQLASFVQKAVRTVQQGESAPETGEQKTGAQPTFQDLVDLVTAADKSGPARSTAAPEAPASPVPVPEEQAQPEPAAPVSAATHESKVVHTEAPAAAEPPPRQPVEPEQVLRQVTRFVKVMVDTKQSEVRLNLHPEHLGQIAVKLVIGDGVLRANMVAQDMAVKAALEANLDQLKTRLSDQGIQVEQVQVTVGGDSQPHHSRHGEQQRQPQQPWRSQQWTSRQEEPGPAAEPQRQVPTNAWLRGTGARLNSLA